MLDCRAAANRSGCREQDIFLSQVSQREVSNELIATEMHEHIHDQGQQRDNNKQTSQKANHRTRLETTQSLKSQHQAARWQTQETSQHAQSQQLQFTRGKVQQRRRSLSRRSRNSRKKPASRSLKSGKQSRVLQIAAFSSSESSRQ